MPMKNARTVREFERAGAAMIQLATRLPQACGHLGGKTWEAHEFGKLRAAPGCAARTTLDPARTTRGQERLRRRGAAERYWNEGWRCSSRPAHTAEREAARLRAAFRAGKGGRGKTTVLIRGLGARASHRYPTGRTARGVANTCSVLRREGWKPRGDARGCGIRRTDECRIGTPELCRGREESSSPSFPRRRDQVVEEGARIPLRRGIRTRETILFRVMINTRIATPNPSPRSTA